MAVASAAADTDRPREPPGQQRPSMPWRTGAAVFSLACSATLLATLGFAYDVLGRFWDAADGVETVWALTSIAAAFACIGLIWPHRSGRSGRLLLIASVLILTIWIALAIWVVWSIQTAGI